MKEYSEEFDRVDKDKRTTIDLDDEFYTEMAKLYKNDFKKHKSPTKRLMQHQKAAYNHKL